MFHFLTKKIILLPLIALMIGVIGIFGVIAQANNDIVVIGRLWKTGLPFWQTNIAIEPGQEFKITTFGGNYSATVAVTDVTIVDDVPQFTSYVPGSSFQNLDNTGIWQTLGDSGASPFAGSGLAAGADGTLSAKEFSNYKYSVKVDDFLPTGTTQLGWTGPILHFTDASGSQTKGNQETTVINIENLPNIGSVTLTPAQSAYKLDDTIRVTIVGAAGKTAYLKIGSITINLTETSSGIYTGSYTVQTGDDLSATPRAYLVNANAKGAYLDYPQNITLDSAPPPAPSGLAAILNPDNTITLGWIAPGVLTDVNHYNIYSNQPEAGHPLGANINFDSPIATATSTATQYTTAILANDVLYKFAVRAVDVAGNTDGNTTVVSKSTDITPPDAPASLVQPTSLNSQILKFQTSIPLNFVWASSPASDLVRYRVEIDDSSDFSSIITSQETVGTTTSYTLQTSTVVLPEGIYFWRVSAIDDADLVSTPATTPDNSFEIDNTAATISVTQPTSGSQTGGSFTMSGAGADSGAHLGDSSGLLKVEVFLNNFDAGQYWNGSAWQAGSIFLTAASTDNFTAWSYQFTAPITDGNLYFTGARVMDKADNTTDSPLISLTGDTVAPAVGSVTITNSTLGSTTAFKNGQSIVLTATINDNLGQASMGVNNIHADLSAITGNVGDSAVAPAAYNAATGLATWTAVTASATTDGAKTITVTALDMAANSGTGNNSIIADNTTPAITAATLTSPTGAGIAWAGNSVKNITWNQAEITDTNLAVNPITLEYTTDGANWTQIATNEANDGTYAWTVPSLNTATVRVRLTVKDLASNTASDSSDNNFTIDSLAPSFSNTILTNSTLSIDTLVKNGDTVVLTSDITDNLLQAGLTVSSLMADFSAITNNPADNAVAPASYNPANGVAVWNFKTVTNTGNGSLSISITATDLAGNAATFTNTAIIVADNTAPAITTATLTSPTASSLTFAGGSIQNITWNNAQITDTHLAANPIKLEYTTDDTNFTTIANNEANDGTYVWTVPSLNSQTVKVRLTASDQVNLSSTDSSDNNFTIDSTAPTVAAAALTAPNGGEAWKQGTSRNITWNSAVVTDNFGLAANPITLEYTTDGSNWIQIVAGEANDGIYVWTTPIMDSTTVRVRLTATDAAGLASSDMSDLTFSIGLPPTIIKAWAASDTLIQMEWSKPLASAGNSANYTATGITATAAAINASYNTVVDLTINALNNTGFTASDLAVALTTVTDVFNFQNEAAAGVAIADLQPPQVNIPNSYPGENQLIADFSPTVRIAVSEAPGPDTVFELNGVAQTISYNAANKVITFTPSAPLPAGKHTISLYMVDLAHNPAVWNPTYDFWIDNFTFSTALTPVDFLFNGNVWDDGTSAEQQSLAVSTYGAGFKIFAKFEPDLTDSYGHTISDIDIKQAGQGWGISKIDLNGRNLVEVASVAKTNIPSNSPIVYNYAFDLLATIPGVLQAAGAYSGSLQFIVVPEY